MRKIAAFIIALAVGTTFVQAQKAFGFGNKIIMAHGVVSPFCMYSKGKTYMIICPAKYTNENGSTESYIDEYDGKATKVSRGLSENMAIRATVRNNTLARTRGRKASRPCTKLTSEMARLTS